MNLAVSGKPGFVELWRKTVVADDDKKAKWVQELRACGVKAAHPNDGWINREGNNFILVYPQFDDGVEIGDLVMLGWHYGDERLVRVTNKGRSLFSDVRYYFEDYAP